jgi:hypothetical protein
MSPPGVTGRQRRWSLPRFWKLKHRELTWLFVGLGACVLLLAFLTLAGEVTEGDTQAFDTKILQALRSPDDPSRPIGPAWLEEALLDITAIGGPTVLALVVLAVIGFMLLQTRFRTALFVATTWLSGELVNSAMKHTFNRPRPTIVPHLRETFSTSFPSGHAMESAIVYLTRHRRAADRPGWSEPRVPRRALSHRRPRGLDHRIRLGVDLLARRGTIRGERGDRKGEAENALNPEDTKTS